MGPFLEREHPRVRAHNLSVPANPDDPSDGRIVPLTARELWEESIANAIEDALSQPQLSDTQVVLLPAWNDVVGQLTVPQPPFTAEDLKFFGNPHVRRVRAGRWPLTVCVHRGAAACCDTRAHCTCAA